MATNVYFGDALPTARLGGADRLIGGTNGWITRKLLAAAGASLQQTAATATVNGATNGIEVFDRTTTTLPNDWLSDPVAATVTISGTITANVWAQESSMSANVAINVIIDVVRATNGSIVNIVKSTRTTELGFSGANTVQNFTTGMTSGAYTGVAVNKGDRLRIRVFGDDAGTMATGFTFQMGYNGGSVGADGDSYVTFSETITFQTTDPAGSIYYLTNTASPVATASTDLALSTTIGSGTGTTAATNTVNGWTAPIQCTDGAGGTVVDWFTPQLQAFTLSGYHFIDIYAHESAAGANANVSGELARVDSDGTNPAVLGRWNYNLELGTVKASKRLYVSGDDLAISDGQRLRVRIYIDDAPDVAMATGSTVTLTYGGDSINLASSRLLLAQTVSELVTTRSPRNPAVNFQDPAYV